MHKIAFNRRKPENNGVLSRNTTRSNNELKINKDRYKRNLKLQTGKKLAKIHRANLTSVGRISTSWYKKHD